MKTQSPSETLSLVMKLRQTPRVPTLVFLILAMPVALARGGQESPQSTQAPGDKKTSPDQQTAAPERNAGEGKTELSSHQVNNLPLNGRDFTKFLTLAGGTTTDTNGANNFTLQFAINGQRGTTAVFAMDGVYTTDPEQGGATFSNFNVDAIQDIQALSGVMPPEIGAGAAGYTNVVTKQGTDQLHGEVFEFLRNASLDARNFFDRRSFVSPGRIPPFQRNEFGFTLGGPLTLPGVLNGRGRTYFFGQYQGFRQELGTTQVLAVPTSEERQGIDTLTFPGDTLTVPVNPAIQPVLERYPLPNDPEGPFGARTYATSSKVGTSSDQFSLRIDHNISGKAQFFARFNLDNTYGPLTDPDQTAIDPSFATTFLDNQRNLGLRYTRTPTANLVLETTLGYLRSDSVLRAQQRGPACLEFRRWPLRAVQRPGRHQDRGVRQPLAVPPDPLVRTRQAPLSGGI